MIQSPVHWVFIMKVQRPIKYEILPTEASRYREGGGVGEVLYFAGILSYN